MDNTEYADRYPRHIGHPFWKGVSDIEVDSAITFNSATYFLSGLFTYKFDNGYAKLEIDKPIISSQFWMNCQLTQEELDEIKSARQTSTSPAVTTSTLSVFMIFLLSFSHVVLWSFFLHSFLAFKNFRNGFAKFIWKCAFITHWMSFINFSVLKSHFCHMRAFYCLRDEIIFNFILTLWIMRCMLPMILL